MPIRVAGQHRAVVEVLSRPARVEAPCKLVVRVSVRNPSCEIHTGDRGATRRAVRVALLLSVRRHP